MDTRGAIGVFDSGIGGLTVVRALIERLPAADIVYFGDTARVPYGTKSASTVTRFSIEAGRFLVNQGVRAVVVACNSSSAVAMGRLREALEVPVFGVVEPGARAAVKATRSGRVGVLGTRATVASGAYQAAIAALDSAAVVHSVACPLLVPLVEEGWLDDPVTVDVLGRYCAPLLARACDTVVLGCTHYPLLAPVLGEVLGPAVTLVDAADEVAREVAAKAGNAPNRAAGRAPLRRYFVSDLPREFERIGSSFLGTAMGDVSWVNQTDMPWFERRAAASAVESAAPCGGSDGRA